LYEENNFANYKNGGNLADELFVKIGILESKQGGGRINVIK